MNTWEILQKAAHKVQYQHLIPLLNEAELVYAVVKGEALSVQAFGGPGRRQSGDIDLLVDKQDVKKLEQILKENGFTTSELTREEQIVARAFSHQVAPYQKKLPLGPLEVDLNYDLLWGEWQGARPSVAEMLSRRKFVDIYGTEVPVLDIPDAFVQLCLHHYKDMNSLYHLSQHNAIRRKLFEDVAGLWQRHRDELDIQMLIDWGKDYQLSPYLYYILHWTAVCCQMTDLEAWAAPLKSQQAEELLEQFGLTATERKKWPLPFEQRLENDAVPELVRGLLTEQDWVKVRQNQKIFGGV